MPRYVEDHFIKACQMVGLKVDARADGLWRVEHVLADLRSDRLQAVRKLAKPETTYRKITFRKDDLDRDQHLDAVLVGPGNQLYAAVDERLNETLSKVAGAVGVFEDPSADHAYRLHFFDLAIRGQSTKGEAHTLYGELIAVRESLDEPASSSERFAVVPADVLLDLPNHPSPPSLLEQPDPSEAADFLKGGYQTEICRLKWQSRQRAENDLADLDRTPPRCDGAGTVDGLRRITVGIQQRTGRFGPCFEAPL